jgi:putative aldouronate transport system substrate-binding protein
MKKFSIAVLAIFAVALPIFAGGGGQKSSSGGSSGSASTNTLSVACLEGWYAAVTINDNLPVWQEIEKRTGIHINWQASSDYDTAMQPVIASGSQLPDIMLIPPTWTNSGVYKLGADGMIRQLDDLIAKNAPNVQKILSAYPNLKALLTAPDGKIYSIADAPMFVNDMVVPNTLFLRQDWLDKLGLNQPVTIDDWHNVLIAFRDKDPNGNGKKDEIPFAAAATAHSGSLAGYLAGAFGPAFGLPTGAPQYWYDKSGKVYFLQSSVMYRQCLETMSQWYKEGLIDLELNRDESNLLALVATNVVGATVHLDGYKTQYNNTLRTSGFTDANYNLIVPPRTPDGSNPQVIKRDPTWSHYGITRDCKNPDVAMKWIDFVWGSDEGVTLNEYGVEGISWTRGADGKPHYTDYVLHNPDGLDQYNALRKLGASDTILVRTPAQVYIDLMQGGEGPAILEFANKVRPFRVEPFPALMLSDSDQAIVDRVSTDIGTYVSETVTKMIIGEIPLSEWDNYVRTLNSMGLAEILAVRQKQYDRSK